MPPPDTQGSGPRLVARKATRSRASALVAACAGLACSVNFVVAQQPGSGTPPAESAAARVSPSDINGRTFSGLRLPVAPRRGALSFAARRAFAWNDGPTQRLLLKGDVRVRIDTVEFVSQRALVWVERVQQEPDGANRYQVYLYLDHAGSPPDAAFDETSSIRMEGNRLPVRGVVIVDHDPVLSVDEVIDTPPPRQEEDAEFIQAGEAQLASSLRRLLPDYVEKQNNPFEILPNTAPVQPIGVETGQDQLPSEPRFDPVAEANRLFENSPIAKAPNPIFAKSGVITLAAGKVTLVTGERENTVMATDGVVLEYTDLRQGAPRTLQVRAQRAVLFLAAQQSDLSHFSAKDVLGFYIEGDASATDGKYTLRGPKIYYDMARNKAVVIDAVFWTYDERRRLPLYVRAKVIRQESSDQFRAESARFSNTAFFEPEFSIGATSVTVSRKVAEPTEAERLAGATRVETTEVDARNITLRGGDVPFFYWPRYVGDPTSLPLRDLRFDNQPGGGTTVRSRWALYELFGIEGPENTSLDLQLDYSTKRGAGLGSTFAWDRPTSKGEITAYTLPSDQGQDVLKSGARADGNGDFRGVITAEERWKLNNEWTAFLEGSYISDERFVQAMFPKMSAERREFTTRLLARRREENTAVFLEASGSLNDFIANEYLLTSKGYTVTRLPEGTYIRQADDLWKQHPGLLTYWSEYRAARLNLSFDETTAASRGLTSNSSANRALGINANQSPADRLRALGLNEDGVFRADTRQEVSMQLDAGPVRLQPFAIGRVTTYDSDFSGFAPNNGRGNDDARLWGAAGVRASTTLQRVYDGVDSRLLDIHRLRHIIEPGVTYIASGTNVESSHLPVFDDEIENLVDGQVVRLGLNQTWQTQRGGPGRWHNVDVFKWNNEIVLSSGDTTRKGPIGHWYDPRPELSWAGNFYSTEATWQITDTLAVSGQDVYDFDSDHQELVGGGVLIRHSPEFSSYVDAHSIHSQDQTILGVGAQYEPTDKYLFAIGSTFDAAKGGFQGGYIDLRRRFESVTVGGSISYDDISGTTSFGFSIQPTGARGGASFGGFGGSGTSSRVGG